MDKAINIIPVSAIIPTINRSESLAKTLESLSRQSYQPKNIIVIDASENKLTAAICTRVFRGLDSTIIYATARVKGAATQRMEGLELADCPFILFMDDDILLENNCIQNLWECLQSDEKIGAANVIVTNQHYHKPGKATAFMYRLMHGKKLDSYAGKCIGPAWNLLPENRKDLPEYMHVEWVNTTCTLYKRAALPKPLFADRFKGYSLMEDLALSLVVSKRWKLICVRDAKIFHDSQQGNHKSSAFRISKMEMVNRFYIMTKVLDRKRMTDYIKFIIFEKWLIISGLTSAQGWKNLIPVFLGKCTACFHIFLKG